MIAAAAAGIAGAAGYFAARRSAAAAAPSVPAPTPKAAPDPRLALLSLHLGEVVSRDNVERWLTGALVCEEAGEIVCAIFSAHGGTEAGFVATFPPPRREIFWLQEVSVTLGPEPPTSFEYDGVVVQRTRRLPVVVRRIGVGGPELEGQATFAEYSASDSRAVLLVQQGRMIAWGGSLVSSDGYDVFGKVEGSP